MVWHKQWWYGGLGEKGCAGWACWAPCSLCCSSDSNCRVRTTPDTMSFLPNSLWRELQDLEGMWNASPSGTSVLLAHTSEMTLASSEVTAEGCRAVSQVRWSLETPTVHLAMCSPGFVSSNAIRWGRDADHPSSPRLEDFVMLRTLHPEFEGVGSCRVLGEPNVHSLAMFFLM